MSAETALQQSRERLMAIEGVVGVGLGLRDGEKVIVVMIERPVDEMRSRLPSRVEDTRVILEDTGPVSAY